MWKIDTVDMILYTDGQGETSIQIPWAGVWLKKQYDLHETAIISGHWEVRWIWKAKHIYIL